MTLQVGGPLEVACNLSYSTWDNPFNYRTVLRCLPKTKSSVTHTFGRTRTEDAVGESEHLRCYAAVVCISLQDHSPTHVHCFVAVFCGVFALVIQKSCGLYAFARGPRVRHAHSIALVVLSFPQSVCFLGRCCGLLAYSLFGCSLVVVVLECGHCLFSRSSFRVLVTCLCGPTGELHGLECRTRAAARPLT
jgi:hypothetical protein